eukprot:gene7437-8020_t
MSLNPGQVEFQLETSYQPPKLTEKEREQLLEKVSQTKSVEDLAEAIKLLKQENEELPDSIKVAASKDKEVKSLQITPNPAFSYKSRRIRDQKKVFINITSHEHLDKPGIKKKLDKDGNEIEGINVPISVGMPREDTDKKGETCLVYDLIVNPVVIEEVNGDKTGRYRDFICQLGIQSLEQKYKEELDKKYKIPKLQYFGETVLPQTVQDRKNIPKIEEVRGKQSSSSSATKKATAVNNSPQVIPEVEKDVSAEGYWIAHRSDHRFLNAVDDHSFTYDLLIKCQQSLPKLSISSSSSSSSGSESFQKVHYPHKLTDYLDPIVEPPSSSDEVLERGMQTIGFTIEIEFQSYLTVSALLKQVQVSLSPFKVAIKLPQCKKWSGYFPTAISPIYSYYIIDEVEGFISQKRFILFAMIDFADFAVSADPGSKTWLVSQALHSDETNPALDHAGKSNPYQLFASSSSSSKGITHINEGNTSTSDGRLAEEKFHISLPHNVDQYTGIPLPPNSDRKGFTGEQLDDFELPEDKFHKKDAGSSFIIQQREQAKQDKWDKYEKEKEERKNDPNVEYIDMNDFKPNAGKTTDTSKESSIVSQQISEELLQAKSVLQASELEKVKGTISSTIWTDLLD